MWLPPRYEVMINLTYGISSTYVVSLLQTSYLSNNYVSFGNTSGMDLGGIWYRQIFICVFKNSCHENKNILGACLNLADCVTLRSYNRLNIIMDCNVHVEEMELNDTLKIL